MKYLVDKEQKRGYMTELGKEWMQSYFITRNQEDRRRAANCFIAAENGWGKVKYFT